MPETARIRAVLEVEVSKEHATMVEKKLRHNMDAAVEIGILDFDDIEIEQYSVSVYQTEEESDAG